jgi:hypothetical protein
MNPNAVDSTSSVAVQITAQPTNKVRAALNNAGPLAGVLAGAIASYGNDQIREVMLELIPALQDKPNATNFFIFVAVTALVWFATIGRGQQAAYNVLDAPNQPIATTPQAAAGALPVGPMPRPG